MTETEAILSRYESTTLREMEAVKLMNRRDTKFPFSTHFLSPLLQELQPFYKVLKINGRLRSTYHTLYYDTPALLLYFEHHRGALNRLKIRHRTYVESNTGYLEVKFKNNKDRTIKERIKLKEAPLEWNPETYEFLAKHAPFDPALLHPSIGVNYLRITLVGIDSAERVTIDTDLEFIYGDKNVKMAELGIVEVKQSAREKTPALLYLKKLGVRPGSVSKYCMAINTMRPEIKKNNFKEKNNSLNKLLHDTPTHLPANS